MGKISLLICGVALMAAVFYYIATVLAFTSGTDQAGASSKPVIQILMLRPACCRQLHLVERWQGRGMTESPIAVEQLQQHFGPLMAVFS